MHSWFVFCAHWVYTRVLFLTIVGFIIYFHVVIESASLDSLFEIIS